jgi:MATE family multidrug resistance protein
LREWVPYHWFKSPDWKAVREFIRLGFPTSMQLLAEVSAFVFAGLLIGTLGEGPLAAHQVAISYAATVFMVPLGISMAMTVRVGEVSGSEERARMRPIIVSGWALGMSFAVLSVSLTLLFNDEIAAWFVTDPQVRQLAAGLLLVGAAFQFSDSFQVISAGSLRGLDDVKVPAWIAFCAYWVISIPLGWTLAIPQGWGVNGIWWGLTLGLTLTAAALGVRVGKKTGLQPNM